MMMMMMMMMITMEGGLGGVGPCLFPSDWDANESLSGKGFLFRCLAKTGGTEETVDFSHKQKPGTT
jgi:hypothetical protein